MATRRGRGESGPGQPGVIFPRYEQALLPPMNAGRATVRAEPRHRLTRRDGRGQRLPAGANAAVQVMCGHGPETHRHVQRWCLLVRRHRFAAAPVSASPATCRTRPAPTTVATTYLPRYHVDAHVTGRPRWRPVGSDNCAQRNPPRGNGETIHVRQSFSMPSCAPGSPICRPAASNHTDPLSRHHPPRPAVPVLQHLRNRGRHPGSRRQHRGLITYSPRRTSSASRPKRG